MTDLDQMTIHDMAFDVFKSLITGKGNALDKWSAEEIARKSYDAAEAFDRVCTSKFREYESNKKE